MVSRINQYRDLVGIAAHDERARADALRYWRNMLSASRYQPLVFVSAFVLPTVGFFAMSLPWWACLAAFWILAWIASNASRNYGVADSAVKLLEGRATAADRMFLDAHGFDLSGWLSSPESFSKE